MRTLRVDDGTWESLQSYLDHASERMGFCAAVATPGSDPEEDDWTINAVMYLDDDTDYAYQGLAGVELADHIRPQLLKWATALDAALIEIHSHGAGFKPTTFSPTDLHGLIDSIPTLLWRLRGQPYGAIVVGGRTDHDSLSWTSKDAEPAPIAELIVGTRTAQPNGLALERLSWLGGAHD